MQISNETAQQAINRLEKIIDAASNANNAGEIALMKANAAEEMYEALDLILPLALGYTASHQVGSNQAYCDIARAALAKAEGRA